MSKSTKQIWVVDDDESIRFVLERALKKTGLPVRSFDSAEAMLTTLEKGQPPQVLVTDIRMPGMDGLSLLDKVSKAHPDLPVIIITAHSDLDSAVSAYQAGAFDYLPKPFDINEAIALVERAIESRQNHVDSAANGDQPLTGILGESPAMQTVFRAIGRLSHSNINVLINGESGTGKELVAQALHQHSPRASGPFIAINMAAIPAELMESELFGHEKGAFTGAHHQRLGRFEQAEGGTLFLDEIGDMPAALQTRLLRVLSDGKFYRVGGHEPINSDVRIIAATHQDLEKQVKDGHFREDLFHRLNVIRIHIPALRERREDIPLLTRHFLKQAANELDVEAKQPREELLEHLATLDWPGNVRQLENTCRRLTVMASGREIHLQDLPPELALTENRDAGTSTDSWQQQLGLWAEQQLNHHQGGLLKQAVPEFETVMIRAALQFTGGKRQDAAKLLGWGRNTLTRKIKELGLDGE
ncbi:MAG TPA: nitrogen regulation protein NR(I) [Chromatiales bacterium]|nr:nitrogen regulation protein NR(I) [Thiotrichales bacterium]HIP69650.1 nitrogen regulation protein NR(I) [Chromatiales bacterium]